VTDDLIPFAEPARLPAPADLKETLRRELSEHVARERDQRGHVHQPEDVFALVRKLAGAHDVLGEYANAFSNAASMARRELESELVTAVGEQDGIPTSGLDVPDRDGTDIRFTLAKGNTHDIELRTVIAAVVAATVARMSGGEPVQADDEDDAAYDERYWRWFAHVIERAIDWVLSLGTYTMQVTKVRAFAATLAGDGEDAMAAVVNGAVNTTSSYRGVKMERKQRRKP
jgi:hypothetical protein